MIRNKSTIQIISRLLMAVFLFVIISPISVYASDSESDNETDEEFETWGEAFSDLDFKGNLAENIARTWATYFVSYAGTRDDVVNEVADYIGDTYDRTISLYDNLYTYILPYSRETVNNIDGANLSTQIYGKPIRNKNNLKLINDYTKTMENSLPSTLVNIAGSKHKTGEVSFDVLPSFVVFENNCKCIFGDYPPVPNNHVYYYGQYSWIKSETLINNNTNGIMYIMLYPDFVNGLKVSLIHSNNFNGKSPFLTRSGYSNYDNLWRYDYSDSEMTTNGTYDGKIIISGSCYICMYSNRYNGPWYYYDHEKKTLYTLNSSPNGSFNENNVTNEIKYEYNIINSVDFTEYNDLINQLMLDVNMSNTITNSLLIELLTELRNQRDVYQPISDSDDIYNYIDYMMNKLLEVKDVHIEIPDLSPNMGGIVDGITALLNFLASIIRAIGSIVSSLLEGLFHLFVPTESDWNEINIQFETLSAPLSWIKDFISEAASNISILLFGRNVTDFEISETEDVENVAAGHGLGPEASGSITATNIVFDPNGAPKIPVRFSNSTSEYFNGIEDAYIIDMSWYAPYKPVGDVIVVAFCWIFFVWRVLHGLPGIINGATGSEDIKDDAHTKVNEIFLR